MTIEYRRGNALDIDTVIGLYRSSTLGDRRPVEDRRAFEQMLLHANLVITAWDGSALVGISRTLTDFAYVAYLSDLAVDANYQRRGIGTELIRETRNALEPSCKIVLLAAPDANDYYPGIGFQHQPRAWILNPEDEIRRVR